MMNKIMIPAAAKANGNKEEDDDEEEEEVPPVDEEEEMPPVISLSPLPLGIGDYGRLDRVVVSALCCHGLVLISNQRIRNPKIEVIHVHNIATRKTAKLPAGTPASYQAAGLCYDGLANVYKVVRMFSHYISPLHCEIFTLGVSNSWTPIATIPPIHQLPPPKHMNAVFTFSNNALHWKDREYTTTTANTSYESKVILVIRAFDPTTEKTDAIPMPPTLPPKLYHDTTLTQLKGCLGLVDDTFVGDSNIWMMVDYMNRSGVKCHQSGEGENIMIPAAAEANASKEEDDEEEEEEMPPVISLSPLPLGIVDYERGGRHLVSALCCHGLVLIYNYCIRDPKIDVIHVHNIAIRWACQSLQSHPDVLPLHPTLALRDLHLGKFLA